MDQLDLRPQPDVIVINDEAEATTETKTQAVIQQPAQTPRQVTMEKTGNDMMDMIRFAASNGEMEMVDKFLAIRDREEARAAEREFNAAYSKMQAELPMIAKRGRGNNSAAFALYEDIIAAAKPVLAKWGLSIRHQGNNKDGSNITVTATLSHISGHSITDSWTARPDDSGKKNAIQSIKSTNSYLKRMSAENLLGIASHGEDDDAFTAETTEEMVTYFDAISNAKDLTALSDVNMKIKADMNLVGKERREVEKSWLVKWTAIKNAAKKAG